MIHPRDLTSMRIASRRYGLQPADRLDIMARKMADEQASVRRFYASDEEIRTSDVYDYLSKCSLVLAVTTRRGDLAGGIYVTSRNTYTRQCFLSVYAFREYRNQRLFFESVILGIDLLFTSLPLQRVRFDVAEYNLHQFASIRRFPGVDLEGVRKDWSFVGGQYWDCHLFSISELGWSRRGAHLATRLATSRGRLVEGPE